jgi:hypothetical protein
MMCCQIDNQSCCGCDENRHRCSCGCDDSSHFERRFFTKEEKIAELQQYLESLRMEIKAVEEYIATL